MSRRQKLAHLEISLRLITGEISFKYNLYRQRIEASKKPN